MVTFFVNSYFKPTNLYCVLGSLIQQTVHDWEAIVLLNSPSLELRYRHQQIVESIDLPKWIRCSHSYSQRPGWDCYWACDWAYPLAQGDRLVFASEDSYYMPEFIEEMTQSSADVVICDILTRKYTQGRRRVFNALPRANFCDKTNFMVRKDRWPGFKNKNTDFSRVPNSDAMTIQWMADNGYSFEKIHLPLVVHN